LQTDISNVSLYLTTFFDLQFNFDKAQVPQIMDWINPWNATSKTTDGTAWAVTNFTGNYVGVYDDKTDVAFAFNFTDPPDWGNIGALGNMQIDAVRFQYQFDQINVNQTETRQYQTLSLTKNSFPTLQPSILESLFSYNPGTFTVSSRDYQDYITQNNIQFIVYDKNQLDTKLCSCKSLQLIYSNDRYDIFKVIGNNNQTQT